MPYEDRGDDLPPTAEDEALDGRLQALLLQDVERASTAGLLSPDFTAAVVERRPFAPWEVRRGSSWRFAGLTLAALGAGSAAIFLAPLWRLGPSTALAVWTRLVVAALAEPLTAAVAAAPGLAEGASRAAAGLSLGSTAAVAAAALASVGGLYAGARARRRTAESTPREG